MPIINPIKDGRFFLKWLHQSYLHEVADLQCQSSEKIWDSSDIRKIMKRGDTGGYIISDLLTPIAYVAYQKDEENSTIWLLNLVVDSNYHRMGIGKILLNQVKRQSSEEFLTIQSHVRESNLAAHLFLSKNGFHSKGVCHAHFKDPCGDDFEYSNSYHFIWKKP